MPDRAPVVLMTGGSTGIGRATAELLAASGFRVYVGMRASGNPDAPPAPAGCEPVELEVTSDDDVRRVVGMLAAQHPEGLFALVNNAGIAPPGPLEMTDLDELRRVLEVNTVAPLRLIQACLPLLRRGRGRIVDMRSLNGKLAMPMGGTYSASKFALEALSDTLRMELMPWRVPVTVIRPGQVRTPIFSKAHDAITARRQDIPPELVDGYGRFCDRAEMFNQRGAQSRTQPEAVARAVLRALRARRPRLSYTVGADARWLNLARWTSLPRVLSWCMAAAMGLARRVKPRR